MIGMAPPAPIAVAQRKGTIMAIPGYATLIFWAIIAAIGLASATGEADWRHLFGGLGICGIVILQWKQAQSTACAQLPMACSYMQGVTLDTWEWVLVATCAAVCYGCLLGLVIKSVRELVGALGRARTARSCAPAPFNDQSKTLRDL